MRIVIVLFLVYVCVVSNGKHIHPRSIIQDTDQKIVVDDGTPTDMIWNIQHSRFVPANNVLFFKKFPPCQEGFERDVLGICREVWD